LQGGRCRSVALLSTGKERNPMSNTRKTKPDLAALLAGARLPERTVDLCLRGDLQAEWETLDKARTEAARTGATSLAGSDVPALDTALAVIEEQMRAAVLTITMRALNRKTYRDLTVAHPPTDADKAKGLDLAWEAFRAALIRGCVVDPEFDDDQWDRLVAVITPAQYTLLGDTADVLNHNQVDVPFSSPVSPRAPSSAAS
jgi:hypothetical protein